MFSAAERAAVDLKQNKGTGHQMLQMLRRAGVKEEEIKVLGLDKFLEGNRKVTKDEIIDHLVENQITVEETVLGDPRNIGGADKIQVHKTDENQWNVFHPDSEHNQYWVSREIEGDWAGLMEVDKRWKVTDDDFNVLDAFDAFQDAIDFASGRAVDKARGEAIESGASLTKHADYVEPGAVEGSYRELLLRLPESKVDLSPAKAERLEFHKQMREKYGTDGWYPRATDAEKAISNQLGDAVQRPEGQYLGGHYGEHPNVLAHVRFNERTGPKGEKVLFIEEIQSDWHQAGRKKGYSDPQKLASLKKRYDEVVAGRAATMKEGETVGQYREKYIRFTMVSQTPPSRPVGMNSP
jgi:hypothetical protein